MSDLEIKDTIVILYDENTQQHIAEALKYQMCDTISNKYDIVLVSQKIFKHIDRKSFNFYRLLQQRASYMVYYKSLMDEKKAEKNYFKQLKNIHKEKSIEVHAEKAKNKIRCIKNMVVRFNPKMIICLSSYLYKKLLYVKEAYNLKANIVAYLTDLGFDKNFLDIRCEKFLVPNEEVKKKLIKYKISKDKIGVVGFPYINYFKLNSQLEKIKEKYEITNEYKNLLIDSHSYGSLNILNDIKKINELRYPCNVFILCRGNKDLINSIKKLTKLNINSNVKFIFALNEDYKDLLSACDILVTPAQTESILYGLANNKAMVLSRPIKMIEKRNQDYLNKNDLAKVANRPELVQNSIVNLLMQDLDKISIEENTKEYLEKYEIENNLLKEGLND